MLRPFLNKTATCRRIRLLRTPTMKSQGPWYLERQAHPNITTRTTTWCKTSPSWKRTKTMDLLLLGTRSRGASNMQIPQPERATTLTAKANQDSTTIATQLTLPISSTDSKRTASRTWRAETWARTKQERPTTTCRRMVLHRRTSEQSHSIRRRSSHSSTQTCVTLSNLARPMPSSSKMPWTWQQATCWPRCSRRRVNSIRRRPWWHRQRTTKWARLAKGRKKMSTTTIWWAKWTAVRTTAASWLSTSINRKGARRNRRTRSTRRNRSKKQYCHSLKRMTQIYVKKVFQISVTNQERSCSRRRSGVRIISTRLITR